MTTMLEAMLGEMASMGVSIGALEKAVRGLAKELEAQGARCVVDAFKSGRGGDYTYSSSSYVDLEVEHPRADDPSEADSTDLRFVANGAQGSGRRDIIGNTWGEMRKQAVARMARDLPRIKVKG